MADDYSDIFDSAGKQYGVDPALLRAMFSVESSNNPNAIGPQTKYGRATGGMQIIPSTAKALGVTDTTDMRQAVPAAAKLLVENARQFGSPDNAVLAYHGGTDRKNWGPKTQAYLAKVTNAYSQLKGSQTVAAQSNDAFDAAFGSSSNSSAQKPTTDDAFSAVFGDKVSPGGTKALVAKSIGAKPATPSSIVDAVRSVPGGIAKGVTAIVGLPGDVGRMEMSGLSALGDKAGIPQVREALDWYKMHIANNLVPSSEQLNDVASAPTGGFYQPQTAAGRYTETAASFLPAMAGGEGTLVPRLLKRVVAPAVGSETAGEAFQGTAAEPYARFTGALLGGGVASAAANGPRFVGDLAAPLTQAGRESLGQRNAIDILHNFSGGPISPRGNSLIPGSNPTLAEVANNPGVSGLQRAFTEMTPNSPLLARQAENSAARNTLFEAAAGHPEDIERAVAARDAAARKNLNDIFSRSNADKADARPVESVVHSILDGPDGNRPAVRSAMHDVLSMMNRNGALINDPKALYNSVRKGIDDLISGKDLSKGYGAQAARELMTVKDALDDAIESGAPGFKKYLSDYAASSAPITSMKFLQGLKLTDATGNMTLQKVQTAIQRLDDQIAAAGVKSGKAVTTAQRDALVAIRDDLLRKQNISAGKAIGSNTVQNLMNQQRLGLTTHLSSERAGAGLGGVLGYLTHGPVGAGIGASSGATIGRLAGHFLPDTNAIIREATHQNLENMLLNPDAYAPAAAHAAAKARPSILDLIKSGVRHNVVPSAILTHNRLLAPQQSP